MRIRISHDYCFQVYLFSLPTISTTYSRISILAGHFKVNRSELKFMVMVLCFTIILVVVFTFFSKPDKRIQIISTIWREINITLQVLSNYTCIHLRYKRTRNITTTGDQNDEMFGIILWCFETVAVSVFLFLRVDVFLRATLEVVSYSMKLRKIQ